ncbi:MAG: PH domain-containing protein [Promethearchaeota archaeon]
MEYEPASLEDLNHIDARLVSKILLEWVILGGFISLSIGIWAVWAPAAVIPLTTVASLVFLIPLIALSIYMPKYVSNFNYKITDKFILINTGVITRNKVTIPFSRIQNVNVVQGPFDRIFNLYTVKIETAGRAVNKQGDVRPEGFIPGVREPEKIEVIVNKLIHKYTQEKSVPSNLQGVIFDESDVAFDQFIAYLISKMREADSVKNKIKELRVKKGLSQIELAEKVGVTRQTIHYLEKGTYNPSLRLAMKIARVLNIKVDDLFELDAEDK